MDKKICPILGAGQAEGGSDCRGDHCAWWDLLAGACCMASGADYIRAVSDALDMIGIGVSGGSQL